MEWAETQPSATFTPLFITSTKASIWRAQMTEHMFCFEVTICIISRWQMPGETSIKNIIRKLLYHFSCFGAKRSFLWTSKNWENNVRIFSQLFGLHILIWYLLGRLIKCVFVLRGFWTPISFYACMGRFHVSRFHVSMLMNDKRFLT